MVGRLKIVSVTLDRHRYTRLEGIVVGVLMNENQFLRNLGTFWKSQLVKDVI